MIYVVTRTSLQTRLHDVADFSPCSAVILMSCKLDATERSMHILRYFSKDVLNMWLLPKKAIEGTVEDIEVAWHVQGESVSGKLDFIVNKAISVKIRKKCLFLRVQKLH